MTLDQTSDSRLPTSTCRPRSPPTNLRRPAASPATRYGCSSAGDGPARSATTGSPTSRRAAPRRRAGGQHVRDDPGRDRRARRPDLVCTSPPNSRTGDWVVELRHRAGGAVPRRRHRRRPVRDRRWRASCTCSGRTPADRLWVADIRRAVVPSYLMALRPADPVLLCGPGLAAVDLPIVFATTPGSAEMPTRDAGRSPTQLVTRLVAAASCSHRSCCTPGSRRRRRTRSRTRNGSGCRPTTARLVNEARAAGSPDHRASARPRCGPSKRRPTQRGRLTRRGRLDVAGGHARFRGTGNRRPDHRLPRAAGVAPGHAHGDRRGAACSTQCYAEALRRGYLWHEFGDINLLLRR